MNSETISADESTSDSKVDGKIRPKLVKWSGAAILAAFCIHRLANFKPQPLDSPATLRPMLYEIFSRLIHVYGTPEHLFERWSTLGLSTLCIPPVLALLFYLSRQEAIRLPGRIGRYVCSRWLFWVTIAAAVLLCRFPTLLREELNPDEGEFLFAAHKLFFDPNYFHSVDCHTSGPLNVYPLMLPAIFGLSPDFASSRLLGAIVIFLCAYFLYKAFVLIASDEIARVAILPVVATFCVFENTELMHMSSEHIPLLWIAIAMYLGVRVLVNPRAHRKALFLLGFTACAAFFTKIQGVPGVAIIAGTAVAFVHASGYAEKIWKPSVLVAAGTLPLLLLNALLCTVGGVWKDFWVGYLVSNWTYPGLEATTVPKFLGLLFLPDEIRFLIFTTLAVGAAFSLQRVRLRRVNQETGFLQMLVVAGLTIATGIFLRENLTANYLYFAYLAAVAAIVYLLMSFRAVRFGLDPVRWFGGVSLASIAIGCYVIFAPHRPFLHYLLFLVLPLCAAMAWMLMRDSEDWAERLSYNTKPASQPFQIRREMAFVSVFVTLVVGYQSYVWMLTSVQPFGNSRSEPFQKVGPAIRPPDGDFVRSVTTDDAQIRVWGWTVRPYLGSGRVGEGRDTHILYCFRQDRFRNYYLRRYLRDMQQRPPDVFIDAVGPASWFLTDRKAFNFEQFPEIAEFIKTNYVHFADLYGQRYFLRRDVAARREALYSVPLPPQTCDPAASSCLGSSITLPKDLPPVTLPEHALLEAEFMAVQPQIGPATVFNNEAVPISRQGFRFQHTTGDRYVLIVGTGTGYVGSKEFTLRVREPVKLAIEFQGNTVRIRSNDSQSDVLHLPHPFANSPGPINLNSWIGSADPFAGKMQFFQILDLEKRK